jgi:hypothetical protein
MGWPKPPLGQKGGGPATPFLGKGVAPDFPPPFFFFFSLFFLKKKKKLKIRNGPKLRRFGQNGVVLE